MFSGIVAEIGIVESVVPLGATDMAVRVEVKNDAFLARVVEGSSVLCAGVCLTVVERGAAHFLVSVSQETLRTTNLRLWIPGSRINLENALRVGDPLDGHIVQGHVDGVGTVNSISQVNGSHIMKIHCDSSMSKFIATKCSVSLDGVSLTVNDASPGSFSVNLVPYTWAHTTLQHSNVGDEVNIETDVIARHIANLILTRT
ncbi:riboflavin synthase [Candidatus Anaplasma sp. TIGMIC]|uniref:riboflavin synthase n=1 Tax=Candidatus Anaplasma sp. TIGMIC TaxID=3020713 RepID=UPI00232FDD0F|nr:riboflavin synthase [Candidatus Anaplasma sp. TIGMIC]MDB1135574.1 riboflavin synthase [Candidatus Anaplasma sp. TIGMIC]